MHKIAFKKCLNSSILAVRGCSCSLLKNQKQNKQVYHHAGRREHLFLSVPDSSPSSQSSISCHKSQHHSLYWCRNLHLTKCLFAEDTDASSVPTSKQTADQTSSKIPKGTKRLRKKLDFTQISTDRNFISAIRALNEYLLKPSDLENIRKIQRRSPYENNPMIDVYLRSDIEMKAIEVWGSQEALDRELKKKQETEQKNREDVFHVKKVIKGITRTSMQEEETKRQEMLLKTSGRVVMTAVVINTANFALKLVAWLQTGSHSMFSEAIHSFADTCNQLLLAIGIKKSLQRPTEYHPYGYHNMSYVTSLISGCCIFCFGTGLSIYHGINGILNPEVTHSFLWAYVVLGGSLLSEGGTLWFAYREIRRGAKQHGMSITEYIGRGQDPSVNVVLLEDVAAVLGIAIAGGCMGLTSYTGLPIYDAIGSLLIGGVLGSVASFIIYTNTGALVGRSIPDTRVQQITKEMENDVMIRAILDVKATDMGNNYVRYKAEIDFDGRELTRSYIDSRDLEALLKEMQNMKSIEEAEAFILTHGESIVDLLGGQVDRIERGLKARHPEIRHADLEVL